MGYQRGPSDFIEENQHLRDAHDHFLRQPAELRTFPTCLRGDVSAGLRRRADANRSVHWLQLAANHPQPDSYYNLPSCMNKARHKRNLARAFLLYRQAARMSHAPSQYNVGLFITKDGELVH